MRSSWASVTGEPRPAVQVLDLVEIVGVSFGPELAYGAKDGLDPFAAVRSARLLVVATPAYKGSYTGLLKIFLDQFEHRALADVTAVPVAVAASQAHADAAASAMRDVLAELGADVTVPPVAVPESGLADKHELAVRWADQHAAAIVHPIPSLALPHLANE